ncbi:hypothetical protein [Dyadobacter sp. CY356]|uniref:hypothetical protein n=1 Tax=Dyadobacter sp. CY356 TaxID=2906442 RepID=UPI001F187F4D|nr:hypothetical protein [Dyadobacter sp. CY356]MCF0056611.1 hypothetical protein [Dyadobacter sp. CY356]
MAYHVNKIILLILLASCFQELYAQKKSWRPEFKSGKIHPFRGTEINLPDYLSDGVAHIISDNDCKIYQSHFFFRVNYLGKVDSVSYNNSTFHDEMAKKIIANIRKTEGHWIIPKHTKQKDFCWFVYPFVDVGINSDCDVKEEILKSHLLQILYLMSSLKSITQTTDESYFIIAPTLRGSPFERE